MEPAKTNKSGEVKPGEVKAALLGIGLDGDDGHQRLTRGENFVLVGGSQDTHAEMQEKAIKFNEKLEKRGKRLEDCSVGEVLDIADDVGMR